jgi:cytochrome c-type biogenesis protein CcmH/NrfG
LHLNLGMLLASQGRFDEAAAQGEEAARLDPDSPEIWEFYARVMQAAGRQEDSAEGRFVLERLQLMKRGG